MPRRPRRAGSPGYVGATTVDVVSGGRLDFGIGAGSRPSHPLARLEYEGHGLPFHDFSQSVDSLAEALTVIRRLWIETEPFDFTGGHVQLTGALGSPRPLQRPHPPILIGGRSAPLLRVAARYADLWNIPGDDIDDAAGRSTLLDRYCTEIGRDPASLTRSIHLQISYDQPRHDPRCDRPRHRRRLRAPRPRAAEPLPGRCRPVGRRRTHHHSGIVIRHAISRCGVIT